MFLTLNVLSEAALTSGAQWLFYLVQRGSSEAEKRPEEREQTGTWSEMFEAVLLLL